MICGPRKMSSSLFVLLSHILRSPPIHSLTFPAINIYLHPYTDLFLCSSPILHLNTTAPSSTPFKPHCNAGFHSSVTSILFVPPPWWSVFPRFCPAFYSAAPLTSAGIIPIMQSLCPDGQRDEFGFLQYKNSTWVHLRFVSDIFFLSLSLSMTKMGSNGFCSHYMVWIAVTITTCSSDDMSC